MFELATAYVSQKPTPSYDDLSPIEKVELDLWQARSAMRKVARAQMNRASAPDEQSLPHDESQGDIYRDATMFRQSVS
jgi:hypothetical protein